MKGPYQDVSGDIRCQYHQVCTAALQHVVFLFGKSKSVWRLCPLQLTGTELSTADVRSQGRHCQESGHRPVPKWLLSNWRFGRALIGDFDLLNPWKVRHTMPRVKPAILQSRHKSLSVIFSLGIHMESVMFSFLGLGLLGVLLTCNDFVDFGALGSVWYDPFQVSQPLKLPGKKKNMYKSTHVHARVESTYCTRDFNAWRPWWGQWWGYRDTFFAFLEKTSPSGCS